MRKKWADTLQKLNFIGGMSIVQSVSKADHNCDLTLAKVLQRPSLSSVMEDCP